MSFVNMITDESDLALIFMTLPDNISYKDTDNYGYVKNNTDYTISVTYFESYYEYSTEESDTPFWRKDIMTNPEQLLFWFDFLDAEGTDIGKYSVSAIGTRAKAINDTDVKTIYYRDIPAIIFSSNETDHYDIKTGYTYV